MIDVIIQAIQEREITLDGVTFSGRAFSTGEKVCGAFKAVNNDFWYFGEVRNGEPDGYGSYNSFEGDTRSGHWASGWLVGHSVHRWPNGAIVYNQHDGAHIAWESTNGTFAFNGQPCDAADARFAGLKRAALMEETLAKQVKEQVEAAIDNYFR